MKNYGYTKKGKWVRLITGTREEQVRVRGMGRPTDLWVRYRYSPAGTGTDTRPCMGMNVSTGPELGARVRE